MAYAIQRKETLTRGFAIPQELSRKISLISERFKELGIPPGAYYNMTTAPFTDPSVEMLCGALRIGMDLRWLLTGEAQQVNAVVSSLQPTPKTGQIADLFEKLAAATVRDGAEAELLTCWREALPDAKEAALTALRHGAAPVRRKSD